MYISQLREEQIQEINVFLAKKEKPQFCGETITILQKLLKPHNDLLGLTRNSLIGLRGEINHISKDSIYLDKKISDCIFSNTNSRRIGKSLADINIMNQKVQHYLLLNTSERNGIFDILFLDLEYRPVMINSARLEDM